MTASHGLDTMPANSGGLRSFARRHAGLLAA
jgi:hypothetical protein